MNELEKIVEMIYMIADADDEIKQQLTIVEEKAIKYTEMRMKWHLMSMEEKIEKSDTRTNAHNRFLGEFSVLRKMIEKETEILEKAITSEDRKYLGDIACTIAWKIALIEA